MSCTVPSTLCPLYIECSNVNPWNGRNIMYQKRLHPFQRLLVCCLCWFVRIITQRRATMSVFSDFWVRTCYTLIHLHWFTTSIDFWRTRISACIYYFLYGVGLSCRSSLPLIRTFERACDMKQIWFWAGGARNMHGSANMDWKIVKCQWKSQRWSDTSLQILKSAQFVKQRTRREDRIAYYI